MKEIIDVLNEHVQSVRNERCSCGEWRPDWKRSMLPSRQHREHVAEMLAAALEVGVDA
jgi:hypothetical protein